jgi:hypothetical protein
VILTKYDDNNMHSKKIEEIVNDLELSNLPIVISSKGGYGIRKLKTLIGQQILQYHLHEQQITENLHTHRKHV